MNNIEQIDNNPNYWEELLIREEMPSELPSLQSELTGVFCDVLSYEGAQQKEREFQPRHPKKI